MFHKSKTVSTTVVIQQGGNLGSTFESMRICKDNLNQEIIKVWKNSEELLKCWGEKKENKWIKNNN